MSRHFGTYCIVNPGSVHSVAWQSLPGSHLGRGQKKIQPTLGGCWVCLPPLGQGWESPDYPLTPGSVLARNIPVVPWCLAGVHCTAAAVGTYSVPTLGGNRDSNECNLILRLTTQTNIYFYTTNLVVYIVLIRGDVVTLTIVLLCLLISLVRGDPVSAGQSV